LAPRHRRGAVTCGPARPRAARRGRLGDPRGGLGVGRCIAAARGGHETDAIWRRTSRIRFP
jgi:hypothetical protein